MTTRHLRPPPPTAHDLMRATDLLIPLWLSAREAGGLLEAAGCGVAPIVDSRGHCVGVFTAADYQRWLSHVGSDDDLIPGHHADTVPASVNEVRLHTAGRFATAFPDTGLKELLTRLDSSQYPFLIVLDQQARPRGIVCALNVLVAVSNCTSSELAFDLAN